ncbi:class I SAM-dependent methyltransferase [Legionella worsleiensis]|uniref:Methyltransferase, ubiE/COQ5 family n=1 Tax=Legionella worsleiensis TaxID=45076 RepID=A0A0W1AK07_9GAMM|nr:class I SAM-dependent methyltransferase [Legionella worsleiensis]KTD81657.1 methyltransferase, ubiE/COQ5 family [Legionella worsleiensis]STY31933.1 methyltransferase, ubiE/COQ5 family [Legionella worsleiensis]
MSQHELNSYLNLCTQFYDLIRPNPPADAYAFYRSYAMNANGPILEPMCGSGRFLLPLLAEQCQISGFDASKQMLEALNAKAIRQNLQPEVWHGFVEDLHKAQKYTLIFIPSGSFGHLIDVDSIKKAVQIFYDHLNEDGILLFEVETAQTIPEPLDVWRGLVCHKPDGSYILVNRLTTYKNNVCYSIDRYELIENGRIVQTEMEQFNVRIYDNPHMLIDILTETGFKEIKLIKAFDNTRQPEQGDTSIVFECRK